MEDEAVTAGDLAAATAPAPFVKRPRDSSLDDDDAPDVKRIKTEPEEIPSADDPLGDIDLDNLANEIAQGISATVRNGEAAESTAPIGRFVPILDADPKKAIRLMSLPALGVQAIQILLILAQQPFEETLAALRNTESALSQAYRTLEEGFQSTVKTYGYANPLISVEDVEVPDVIGRKTIYLANIAMISLALFDGESYSVAELHDTFLAALLGGDSDLSSDVGELFLGVKTQLAIQLFKEKGEEALKDSALEEAFITNVEDKLRDQHPDIDLTAVEQDFLASCQARKEALFADIGAGIELEALQQKYPYEDSIRRLNDFLNQQRDMLYEQATRLGMGHPDDYNTDTSDPQVEQANGIPDLSFLDETVEKALVGLGQTALESGVEGDPAAADATAADVSPEAQEDLDPTDYTELEALIDESTENYVRNTLQPMSYQPSSAQIPSGPHANTQVSYHPQHIQGQHHPAPAEALKIPPGAMDTLPPNQTKPSTELYDIARQAALSKTTTHTRREGIHSTRRPWTFEEERCLMMGLDLVKGPHWSQILQLFGHKGSINEVLKDRTQVQLKDKARNLKLFFLKSNSEMPYFLSQVTGELKTRAPIQAARKEAEERARLTSDEQQAHVQGVMVLASGLQNLPQGHPPKPLPAPPHSAAATSAPAIQPAQAVAPATSQSQPPSVQRHQLSATPTLTHGVSAKQATPQAAQAAQAPQMIQSQPAAQAQAAT